MALKRSLRYGPFITYSFSIRRGPPSPNSNLSAFQDVVASLETAVPAIPEIELIMMRPYVSGIRVYDFPLHGHSAVLEGHEELLVPPFTRQVDALGLFLRWG
jgi:hypothetical protein